MRINRLSLVSGVLMVAGMFCLCGTATAEDCYSWAASWGSTSVINGTSGNDILTGTNGVDEMHGLGGADTFYGLEGNDCEDDNIWSCTSPATMNGGNGNDELLAGAVYAYGGDGADYGSVQINCATEYFEGGGKADGFFGYANDPASYGVTFYGQGNDDTLLGSYGNDYLDGGFGYDQIWGIDGTDTCVNGEVLQTCP